MSLPLKYKIDSWDRLTECMSNISDNYYITVDAILGCEHISGKRISVCHKKYGVMFACMTSTSGSLIDTSIEELSKNIILKELKRYGFDVRFTQKVDISDKQLYKLRGLYDLGYDRLRVVQVNGNKNEPPLNTYVVAFKSEYDLDDWLNNWFSPTSIEFNQAVQNGNVYMLYDTKNVTGEDWSWAYGSVYLIRDILSMYSSHLYDIARRDLAENLSHKEDVDEDIRQSL